MHKGLQWAMAGMVFIIMVAVAGPPILRWLNERQESRAAEQAAKGEQSFRKTQEAIEYFTSTLEKRARTEHIDEGIRLTKRCFDTGNMNSLECKELEAHNQDNP